MRTTNQPKKPLIYYGLIAFTVLILLNTFFFPNLFSAKVQEVSYGQFMEMIDQGRVEEVEITSTEIVFADKDENYYKTGPVEDPALTQRLYDAGIRDFGSPVIQQASPLLGFLISWIFPILIFMGLGQFMMRQLSKKGMGGNAMSFGKSNAKVYVPSSEGIKFSDVAGEDEAKELLAEIVDFLHDPGKYAAIGARAPKGALLVGPPGTGKTLLAKAVAGEAGVPFFSISGSEFVEMFVGMGAAKVRDLFKQAAEKAPCIVFIDEIDTIGKKRDGAAGLTGGNDEREQTLNQLLTEMDGFDATKGVIILAATNRPDSLDPALLRPGRFDRRIPVELPDLKGRREILQVHARKVKMSPNVDFDMIARMAAGASGAELANMVNEAALRAVRDNRRAVTQNDLMESVEVVIAGYKKKNAILSDKEKMIVAYHEIGHALVAALQSHSAPVSKITIIPRTSGALGYTMQVEERDKTLLNQRELENKICTYTGGRVAEELVFGTVTTGASNDIEMATKIARQMVTRFGMSDFGMMALETTGNVYLGGDSTLTCSAETAALVDKKVEEIIRTQYEKAKELLRSNMGALHTLAKHLYTQETITGPEFMYLMEHPEFLALPGGEGADANAPAPGDAPAAE